MSYRTLGHSGLQVSTLTLGTMMFGEQTSTEDSLRIIDCLLYTSPSPRD